LILLRTYHFFIVRSPIRRWAKFLLFMAVHFFDPYIILHLYVSRFNAPSFCWPSWCLSPYVWLPSGRRWLPSGRRLHNELEKHHSLMGKSTN
jgi:hypothetical protein